MKRREMMKLASLAVMLPMMPGVAKANPKPKTPAVRYKVFTAIRPGRDVPPGNVPPGKESLIWIANSATLIYGERDAVLVDTFMTVEQCNGLADAIEEAGRDKASRAAADDGDGSFRHVDRIERSIHGARPLHGRSELYASPDRGFPK